MNWNRTFSHKFRHRDRKREERRREKKTERAAQKIRGKRKRRKGASNEDTKKRLPCAVRWKTRSTNERHSCNHYWKTEGREEEEDACSGNRTFFRNQQRVINWNQKGKLSERIRFSFFSFDRGHGRKTVDDERLMGERKKKKKQKWKQIIMVMVHRAWVQLDRDTKKSQRNEWINGRKKCAMMTTTAICNGAVFAASLREPWWCWLLTFDDVWMWIMMFECLILGMNCRLWSEREHTDKKAKKTKRRQENKYRNQAMKGQEAPPPRNERGQFLFLFLLVGSDDGAFMIYDSSSLVPLPLPFSLGVIVPGKALMGSGEGRWRL